MNFTQILFDPLVSWPMLTALAACAVLILAVSVWLGLIGWFYRFGAALLLLLALMNPSLQREERETLTDIVLVVVDESASQSVSERPAQTAAALAHAEREIEAIGMEARIRRVFDAENNSGTRLMTALREMLAEEPRSRIAGALLITDGRFHDAELVPDLPAPLHALITGNERDWDRRLIIETAPAFAIIGEEVVIGLRIEDQGAIPEGTSGTSEILISVDGGQPQSFTVPIGEPLELPLTLEHAGQNVIQFTLPEAEAELTTRNNEAVVQINGIRDRLRVLLVSGEPHPGQRTWRNLLKSDPSVDLVHFTILRPPGRQDGAPVGELSLIAFPTRELFMEAIDEFDLIIFDRYQRRGILPMSYLDNIRRYVIDGGALLLAAGPDFAGASSLYRTPLAEILPGAPTARVIEDPYLPLITDIGARHPVTTGLMNEHRPLPDSNAPWGRWFRQVELNATRGQTVLEGAEGAPLLLLDRAGAGRVALLASDHAWLWDRGFEGGGPQLELLRRLAHWMMGEPDLEEESLNAVVDGSRIFVTRRSLEDSVGDLIVIRPDGSETVLGLMSATKGTFTAEIEAPDQGLYRLRSDDLERVIVVGPAAPREFEVTIAGTDAFEQAITEQTGRAFFVQERLPAIRAVSEGRPTSGRTWLGLTRRDAYTTSDVTVTPLIPTWLLLVISAGMIVLGWMREGRR